MKIDAQDVPWRAAVAGLSASLVGLGLARFAYTPLLPAIVGAHWFSAAQASYLGAANLAGYLAGALVANPMARRWSAPAALRAMMTFTTLALFACAWPVDFAWFFAWRFVSGLGGGALMVLAAPTVLSVVPAARRGTVSGLIFMGVGIGVAASGTLVPLMLKQGLTATWLSLAVLALLLTVLSWGGWPQRAAAAPTSNTSTEGPTPALALRALFATYALNAAGLVPHMIFLVAYIARGLGQGLAAGSRYWLLFGLGATAGPVVSGLLADRIGFRRALRLALLAQALAVAIPALGQFGAAGLVLSSVVVGAFTPGIVPLALGNVQALLADQPALHRWAWSQATTAFAVLQAATAYGMSFLLERNGGDYAQLFEIGTAALLAALIVDLGATRLRPGGSAKRLS
ncbi:MAG: YbfB/YjiJ family MFS transporter [Paucibacter sp.]|nr:YbfB/YjiJ family MFS transporter [Roseateles sp.]